MGNEIGITGRLKRWSAHYSGLFAASSRPSGQVAQQLQVLKQVFDVDEEVDVLRELSDFVLEARQFQSDICDAFPSTEMLRPFFRKVADDLVPRLSLASGANAWAPSLSKDGASKLEMAVPLLDALVGTHGEAQNEAIERLTEIVKSFLDDPLDDPQLNKDVIETLIALISAIRRGDSQALRLTQHQLHGTIFVTNDSSPSRARIWETIGKVAAVITILQGAMMAHGALPPPNPEVAELEIIEAVGLPTASLPSADDEE